MKFRIQLSPALTAALLCAAGWYSLWLLAFRPAPQRQEIAVFRPAVAHLASGGEALREILRPDRFALPSPKGYSGLFPESGINLSLNLEKPARPAAFLELEHAPSAAVSILETAGSAGDLPIPGIAPEEKK